MLVFLVRSMLLWWTRIWLEIVVVLAFPLSVIVMSPSQVIGGLDLARLFLRKLNAYFSTDYLKLKNSESVKEPVFSNGFQREQVVVAQFPQVPLYGVINCKQYATAPKSGGTLLVGIGGKIVFDVDSP
jgi:hypothetical protein